MIIDLEMGIGWDGPVDTYIKQEGDSSIVGYRFSKGWAADQRIFFSAQFSEPISSFLVYDSITVKEGMKEGTGKRIKGVASFKTRQDQQIKVKVGISPVSIENARLNINAEIPGWDFNEIVTKADAAWNKELNKIKITTSDSSRMRTFYTALYHTMIAPSIFNDHNGDYRGTDKKIYEKATFTNLTTFSLWDTYRAAHPLYTIFQPERVKDMVNSMLAIYQQQGKLPIWHLMGNETNTMPGYSSVQVIADAYLKGFNGFDTELAWEAVRSTAMQDERGLKYIKQYGFIPADSMVESVAMGLEYAIADWGIMEMAKKMNKPEYKLFAKRAKAYQLYFDSATGFVRGRLSADKWRTPFSPFVSRHMKDDFAEGNAWQYTWLAPQDVKGLIEMLGGYQKFIAKLDSLFTIKGDMGAEASSDITVLIGQYAHGNEPSHHIPYLYAYAGQQWKTAEKVRYILDSLYSDRHDGLCGNEDVGQMSAWYILSALGIYQVNPSEGVFIFGSPIIDKATLQLPGNKELTITVNNNNSQNKYIQSMTLNGEKYDYAYITYKQLIAGGNLIIEMGPTPHKDWGTSPLNN